MSLQNLKCSGTSAKGPSDIEMLSIQRTFFVSHANTLVYYMSEIETSSPKGKICWHQSNPFMEVPLNFAYQILAGVLAHQPKHRNFGC